MKKIVDGIANMANEIGGTKSYQKSNGGTNSQGMKLPSKNTVLKILKFLNFIGLWQIMLYTIAIELIFPQSSRSNFLNLHFIKIQYDKIYHFLGDYLGMGIWIMIIVFNSILLYKKCKNKKSGGFGNINTLKNVFSGFYITISGKKKILIEENTDGHFLIVGGQGSGKTAGVAIPTLQHWKDRVFAIDIKPELRKKSEREKKHPCKVFGIGNLGYNPFYLLRKNEKERVPNAREIAMILIPLDHEVKDPIWIQSAQNLLTAAILYWYKDYTFGEVIEKTLSSSPRELVTELSKSEDNKIKIYNNAFVDMADKQLASVYNNLTANLADIASNDTLLELLSDNKNNIIPDDILSCDIFLEIKENLLEQWGSVTTMITNQFLKFFESRNEYTIEKNTLFMLDEFARLGKMPSITNGLATLRSKKVKMCLILQSLSQLDLIYGENTRKVIADNCNYKIILKATDPSTQKYFSDLLGTHEVEEVSHSNAVDGIFEKNKTKTRSIKEKNIFNPELFGRLDKQMILIDNTNFYMLDQTRYYEKKYQKSIEK